MTTSVKQDSLKVIQRQIYSAGCKPIQIYWTLHFTWSTGSYYHSLWEERHWQFFSVSGWLRQMEWMLLLLFGCGHTHTSILEQKLWEPEELIFWDPWRTLKFLRRRLIGELTMKPEKYLPKTGLDCFWGVSGSLFCILKNLTALDLLNVEYASELFWHLAHRNNFT